MDPMTPAERHAAGLRAVVGYPFVDRVGRSFHYSDLGFMLLGESVRRLSGRSLDAVVQTGVAEPLGLADLVYRPMDAGIDRDRIVPTSEDALWRHRRCWGEVEDENCAGMGGIAGHAGLFATTDDVARLGQAWLVGARGLGIDARVAAEATTDQTSGLDVTRGLGWQLRGDRPGDEDGAQLAPLGPGAFGHSGFTGTSLVIDPDRELVVVLLTNRVHASRTHEGIERLREDVTSVLAGAVRPLRRTPTDRNDTVSDRIDQTRPS
jgi:CubicO group peptidase (beta-lactamase class C family)